MDGVASSSSSFPPLRGLHDSRRDLSAQDWENQRPKIERLYSAEQKKLREVMQIMEKEYGFFATCVFLSFVSSLCSYLRSIND
jgi:hypothetical protein